MENTKQVTDLAQEEIKEMLESGEIVVGEVEEEINEYIIPFSTEIIAAHEEASSVDHEDYKLGVKDASRYIGQFHSLINAGLNSETAIVIMSWIREGLLNDSNIKGNIEIEKIRDIKIQQASL